MKKILLALSLVLLAGSSSAQHFGHHGHYGHGGHRGGWGWGPVLGGAIAGAVIYDIYNRPVVVQQPPIVVQPNYQAPPAGYHWQEMIDPQTNTRKIVLVPNQ